MTYPFSEFTHPINSYLLATFGPKHRAAYLGRPCIPGPFIPQRPPIGSLKNAIAPCLAREQQGLNVSDPSQAITANAQFLARIVVE